MIRSCRALPLSSAGINNNFSNTTDLAWLQDIGHRNKVILIAEEHYHQTIADFRTRILFYLNTIDRYPLLVMEAQYSYTAYLNYFINLPGDREAEKYYSDVIYDMVPTQDALDLMRLIRKWNKEYPIKKITLGFSDIEHDYRTTIKNVILPYFKKINNEPEPETNNLSIKDLGGMLPHFFTLLDKAKKTNLIGGYPFITPNFIGNVLTNLESTYKAYYFQFDYYRQRQSFAT